MDHQLRDRARARERQGPGTLADKLRAGQVSIEQVNLAAMCGHEASIELLGECKHDDLVDGSRWCMCGLLALDQFDDQWLAMLLRLCDELDRVKPLEKFESWRQRIGVMFGAMLMRAYLDLRADTDGVIGPLDESSLEWIMQAANSYLMCPCNTHAWQIRDRTTRCTFVDQALRRTLWVGVPLFAITGDWPRWLNGVIAGKPVDPAVASKLYRYVSSPIIRVVLGKAVK